MKFIITLLLTLLWFANQALAENWQTVEDVQAQSVRGFSDKKSCLPHTKTACVQIDGVDLEIMDLILRGRDWVFVENADKIATKTKRLADEKQKADELAAKLKAMQDAGARIKNALPQIDLMTTTELKALIKDMVIERGL